ncbi:hypothetical protein SLS57_002870 [Botryosphaeria dothidea]
MFPPPELKAIAKEVTELLKERKETLSVAETAAGGLTSASILASPGASAIFKGGLQLYTLESRIAYAGWTEENLKDYTGPTPEIVKGIAENVRPKLDTTYTICESGTAGPTGGDTRNRTPGYVALAVSSAAGTATREIETGLGGDREANMLKFAVEGLTLLRDVIKGDVKL